MHFNTLLLDLKLILLSLGGFIPLGIASGIYNLCLH